jgi:methyltransferase, FkbM family
MVQDGKIQSFIWTSDTTIGRQLFAWRARDSLQLEDAVARLDRYVAPAEMVFVDVGANTGTASLAALASERFSFAIAVEPEPRSLRLLRANAGLNGYLDRMYIVAAAASDVEGEALLFVDPYNYGDNVVMSMAKESVRVGQARSVRPGSRTDSSPAMIAVPSVRLDEALKAVTEFHPSRAFYWVDVQGHEVQALRGLGTLLASAFAIVTEIEPAGWTDSTAGDTLARMLSETHEWFVEVGPKASVEREPISNLGAFCNSIAAKGASTNILIFGPTNTIRTPGSTNALVGNQSKLADHSDN